MLVDSHCHLNFPEFSSDLEAVIARAQENGVGTMLTINTKLSESKEIQDIADLYSFVFCTVGVHPHEASQYVGGYEGDVLFSKIKSYAQHPKVVGIGETGLDYYYNNSPREDQISSFSDHIRASIDLDLPLIIHTRDADEDTITCLKEVGNDKAKGVFHCFSGSAELAQRALDLGFYISFSGILTFKNADPLRQIAQNTPVNRILVETDAPFLAPVPYRGKRNEPAFVRCTAELLASIKGLSYSEIEKETTNNFFSLFPKARLSL
ncbi:MAG: TatD family deoxyribonuclease [Alphaproteobacteria bacterium]|nr:TatD family deoxyribonuclease [Alphaproteobacteria bacterium]